MLDENATDYDAIITTGRLTVMNGDPETVVSGLAQAWRQVTRQGVPCWCFATTRRSVVEGREPAVLPRGRAGRGGQLDVRARPARQAGSLVRRADAGRPSYVGGEDARPDAVTTATSDTCPVVIGGVNVYRDDNHVTVTYAKTLAPYLYRAIVESGVLPRDLTG